MQKQVWYGGDYCPEQWDRETMQKDMALFREAGVNLVTLPVFGWARLEPEESVYDFAWLDEILQTLQENGISVCLATATAAQPAWMSEKYPEVLPVDIAGRKRTHGMRMFFCVNSPKYRERAAALAEQMAMRYKDYPGLVAWHVANEYSTFCYCPTCEAKFRRWLAARYGDVQTLNDRWYAAFWGRAVTSFDEVRLPTELNDDYRFNPAVQLDYLRFVSETTAECFRNEADVLRKVTPDIPIFSNISGYIRKLDQFLLNEDMDLVGWDNYPAPDGVLSLPALKLDIMRGLRDGAPFWVVEQSPAAQNWQPYNKLKKPGEVRRIAYQGIARGADASLFFQLRQSRGGQEKLHGALIGHAGTSDTRTFRECSQLGSELKVLGDACVGLPVPALAAFLLDWDNWWALELSSGPSADMDYLMQVHHYYKPFYHANLPVSIVRPGRPLDGYKLVVAPLLYMMKPGVAAQLADFVRQGGTLVATYMTGHVDDNARYEFGAVPGPLREVLGLWVEEADALLPAEKNRMRIDGEKLPIQHAYDCGFLCDVLRLEGAEPLAFYGEDFYAGTPCVTRNRYGAGTAYYIASQPEDAFLTDFVAHLAETCGIAPPLRAPEGIEVQRRALGERSVTFVINNTQEEGHVTLDGSYRDLLTGTAWAGELILPAGDVAVLSKQ